MENITNKDTNDNVPTETVDNKCDEVNNNTEASVEEEEAENSEQIAHGNL